MALVGGMLLASGVSSQAFACAVCFGDPSSSQTHGMNWAIITMLALIAMVFAGLAAFVYTLWRRAGIAATQSVASVPLEEIRSHDWPDGHPVL